MARTPRETVEEFFERMGDPDERGPSASCSPTTRSSRSRERGLRGRRRGVVSRVLEPRYERAGKAFGQWTVDGDRVVSQGTLHGVDNDGERFEDVRYVDVYEVCEGAIRRLDVYNDPRSRGVEA